jgi:1-hydroxycarotenoid 3,4-desaturase
MAEPVVIIGAGVGGLAAAALLAARGLDVLVVEKETTPGGKLREVTAGSARIDAGPTVFTMRWVFEEIFAAAGSALDDHVTLTRSRVLARHAWPDGSGLDLFADRAESADAIGRFAGAAEARGFEAFAARAARIWRTLEGSFIRQDRPSVLDLVAKTGARDLMSISPFTTLDRALGEHFRDPRLRQLFGRYATYCGSSPFDAPATLMLVAHVESEGVWLVEGGMHRLAVALAGLAEALGARLRYGVGVRTITERHGRVSGVVLADGEQIEAAAVICNGDSNAVAAGLFGPLRGGMRPTAPAERSLSALTWAARTVPEGFPLLRHTVFFSQDYRAEFDALKRGRLPEVPTVYICAQDRTDQDRTDQDRTDQDRTDQDRRGADVTPSGHPERLLCLVNAPATGDAGTPTPEEIARCEERTLHHLRRCGLTLTFDSESSVMTGPAQFGVLFPATGGALYGPNAHGWAATFRRPGARTTLPGLYLAGGSTHPGPGVPMAALSGRLAASALMADLDSTARSR